MRDKLGENIRQKLWDEYQLDNGNMSESEPEEARPLASRLAQWVGGLVSLALVLGLVYWVFELGRRDANEVPVIQAMDGAAREVPKDQGGVVVENQGLQVNEVLAAENTAPIEPETRLAPSPQRVGEGEVPVAVPETVITSAPEATPTPEAPVDTAAVLPTSLAAGADPSMLRPVRRSGGVALSPDADILSDAIANAISEALNEESAAQDTANQNPDVVAPLAAAPPVVEPQAVPAPTFTPAPAPAPVSIAGERMIQFGSFDDEQSAMQEWEALLANNQDLLGTLTRFVERREAGGRVFYRLRARGFADMDEATDMCTVLLARDVSCIAVTAR
ncbi:MAG: SPOR domain-containing protein [Rhodobacteraceae bacterium]|nr:SPOR domain-containing protein [Paracoccaceae bacterium]